MKIKIETQDDVDFAMARLDDARWTGRGDRVDQAVVDPDDIETVITELKRLRNGD